MYTRKVRVKNKVYYQEVEAYWEDGKKKLRVIRHLGTNPAPGGNLGTNKGGPPGPSAVSVASSSGEDTAEGGGFSLLAPPAIEDSLEEAAVQTVLDIPLDSEPAIGPFIIKEYAVSSTLAAMVTGGTGQLVCWRIKGVNGAWWPAKNNPKNFLSFEEAQEKLRELGRKEGNHARGKLSG